MRKIQTWRRAPERVRVASRYLNSTSWSPRSCSSLAIYQRSTRSFSISSVVREDPQTGTKPGFSGSVRSQANVSNWEGRLRLEELPKDTINEISENGSTWDYLLRPGTDFDSSVGSNLLSDEAFTIPDDEVRFILVPIGFPGCGKTTMGRALQDLLGWKLVERYPVESDAKYYQRLLEDLRTSPVVFCDRSNHRIPHRIDLLRHLSSMVESSSLKRLRLVALSFDMDDPRNISNVVKTRVLPHGVAPGVSKEADLTMAVVNSAIENHLSQFEPYSSIDADIFDLKIELTSSSSQSTLSNVALIVNLMKTYFPQLIPQQVSDTEIETAVLQSLNTPRYLVDTPEADPEDTMETRIRKTVRHEVLIPPAYYYIRMNMWKDVLRRTIIQLMDDTGFTEESEARQLFESLPMTEGDLECKLLDASMAWSMVDTWEALRKLEENVICDYYMDLKNVTFRSASAPPSPESLRAEIDLCSVSVLLQSVIWNKDVAIVEIGVLKTTPEFPISPDRKLFFVFAHSKSLLDPYEEGERLSQTSLGSNTEYPEDSVVDECYSISWHPSEAPILNQQILHSKPMF